MARKATNHANADPCEFLRGRLASEDHSPVFPDDYATEHDHAEIPELADAIADAA